ncbi:hypothetical protein [Boudabousia marimammalium]|uniref:Orotate phosphoribosyltransferase n=1 Tax=Boudabousia marimammalium TaxID=156892 RepID=A0A1Q5PKK0_9ACTO|nr:hypothetical protein [Boudabousia marimammalium]OKL46734.1 hypothetical protein BM477_07235 [Boudabousia marimammalium]
MAGFANDPQKSRLAQLWVEATGQSDAFPIELVKDLTLHHEAAPLLGHVLLDALEEAGFAPDEVAAVGACAETTELVGLCVLFAAASRGLGIDAFQVEGRTPSALKLMGPSTEERNLVLVIDGAGPAQVAAAVQVCQEAGGKVVSLVQLLAEDDADVDSAAQQEITALGIGLVTLFTVSDVVAG